MGLLYIRVTIVLNVSAGKLVEVREQNIQDLFLIATLDGIYMLIT